MDIAIENDKLTAFDRLLAWREQHISQRTFILFLAFLVGFFCAVAAFLLHSLINEIVHFLTSSFDRGTVNWLYLVYPAIGIFLTSLFVRYVVKDNISHGITRILYAISSKKSRLRAHNCWSSLIASAITIGFGGSVGAEAPIVLTGSAIGSNLGKLFRMDNKTLMLLVGCGAAGAIAAETTAAEPPLEPPGTRVKSKGFLVLANALVCVEPPIANSSMLVLPRST